MNHNQSKRNALSRVDPFMTTLIVILMDTYGPESLGWDIETIRMELEEDFQIQLTPEAVSKIGCGLQIMGTDSFWKSLPDFIQLCNIISGDTASPNMWNPADAFEITAAVAEVRLLNPPEGDLREYINPEIIGYMEIAMRDAGILVPPGCLDFLNPEKLSSIDLSTIQEDPQLYAAGYQEALAASNELSTYESGVLSAMLAELGTLDLDNGDVKTLLQKEELNGNNKKSQRVSGIGT